MSAVSKRVTPASRAAATTSRLRASSMRPPKLLQPRPTTETSSDPIERVCTAAVYGSAMAEETVTTAIDASPDEVWKLVGDFEGIDKFFPGIESLRIEGDTRVIGMMGIEVSEQLLERNDSGRRLVYSVVGGVPIESHRATVTVGEREGGSIVEWAVEVKPDEMLPIFVDVYQQALAQVREKVTG